MIRIFVKIFRAWWRQDRGYALRYLPLRSTVVLWTIAFGWLTTTKARRERLFSSRQPTCLRCDMFNRTDGTCGTIGEFIHGYDESEQLGCWCLTRFTARLPKNSCWKTRRGIPGGWTV